MANVSVYNIEGKEVGKIDLSDAVFGVEVNEHLVHMAVVTVLDHCKQILVLLFLVVVVNDGDRREPVMQDRVLQELHSGQAAELYSHRFREIILSK